MSNYSGKGLVEALEGATGCAVHERKVRERGCKYGTVDIARKR